MLAAQQPMFVAWGEQRILLYNDAYAPLLGERHPSALGRPLLDVWPDAAAEIAPLVDRVFAGDAVHMDDIGLILDRGDGKREAHFAFSYTPVIDQSGAVAGLFCVCAETTAQVRAVRQVQAEHERFAQLFEKTPTFMVVLAGREHRIELANPGFEALIGRPVQIGKSIAEALPDAVEQGYLDQLNRVFESGAAFVANGARYVAQSSAGGPQREHFVDFVFQPIKDRSGKVTGIFVHGADVTERMRAFAALRESEACLRDLNADLERQVMARSGVGGQFWQICQDLLGVLRPDGCFDRVNPAWQTMLGWSEADLRTTPIFDLIHPDDVDRTRASFLFLKEGNPVLRFENRYRAPGGRYLWIAWSAIPLGEAYYCSGRNITVEKAAQEELAAAQEALRQSQKMEAVGQLTGGLAHDFNNLITGIAGSLDLLQTRLSQGRAGETARYIAAAQGACKRAAALTHRLLAFSRRQMLDPRPTDVRLLVADMADLVRRTMGPAITVEFLATGAMWATLVDRNQLENALLNLCLNARDAMPHGGRLTIETASVALDAPAAQERGLAPGQYVKLCVSDTGEGMSRDVVQRAFEPFFTTKPLGMGTGLGLSMIYGFVRQSGGQPHIASMPGIGTKVSLYLPRHAGQAELAHQTDPAFAKPPLSQGKTVLVVDDEATLRMLMTDILLDEGHVPIEAGDGAAALKVLRSDVAIDLLVTDIGLPGGMNGRQVADAARMLRPALKVLFITGYAETAVKLDAGMHLLRKPFAMETLVGKMRGLMGEG
jgi:PAS domain S-box-containing protein